MSSIIGKNLMEMDPTLLPEEPEVNARYEAGDLPEEIAQRFINKLNEVDEHV